MTFGITTAPTSPTCARRWRVLEVSGSAAGGVRAHLGDCARLLARAGHDVLVEAPPFWPASTSAAPGGGPLRLALRPLRAMRPPSPGCGSWGDAPMSSTPMGCAPAPPPLWRSGGGAIAAPAWSSPSTISPSAAGSLVRSARAWNG